MESTLMSVVGLDVCGVVIVANTIRIFFWLGKLFETRELARY